MLKKILLKYLMFLFFIPVFTRVYAETRVTDGSPFRFAVARMTHDHIAFILERLKEKDYQLQLVGIFETDQALVEKYAKKYNLARNLFYDNLEKMLDQVKPEAVLAFGSVFDHLSVVEACAPRGINVMVEKPLAVNMEHAARMKALADKYNIKLLTDFETSWYPSTAKSWQLLNDSNYVGSVRKVVVHDGHQGPVEIGCSPQFLAWLTDPVLNGGGAITDFGCYGANLMTWLTKGAQPLSVTAVTRQFKPSIYPKVDDDATIIVSYPRCECIIEASWNWPFGRKDMEIYGDKGYIFADNRNDMRLKNNASNNETRRSITANDSGVFEDPFLYFKEVVRKKIMMSDYDQYSLENNILVVKILDAARESAKTGKSVSMRSP